MRAQVRPAPWMKTVCVSRMYVCYMYASGIHIKYCNRKTPRQRAERNAVPKTTAARKVADEHYKNDVAATGSTCGTQDRAEDLRKIRRQSPSTPTMTPTDRLSTHTARLISGDYGGSQV